MCVVPYLDNNIFPIDFHLSFKPLLTSCEIYCKKDTKNFSLKIANKFKKKTYSRLRIFLLLNGYTLLANDKSISSIISHKGVIGFKYILQHTYSNNLDTITGGVLLINYIISVKRPVVNKPCVTQFPIVLF